MTNVSLPGGLSKATAKKLHDLTLEVTERLEALFEEFPSQDRETMRKACDRAASLLEKDCPAVIGMGSDDGVPLAGLYSALRPGSLMIVVAGPTKSFSLGMRVTDVDSVIEAAQKLKKTESVPFPLFAEFLLENEDEIQAGGLSAAGLGMLLDINVKQIDYLKSIAAGGAIPAHVTLISEKHKATGKVRTMRLVMPHGLALPKSAFDQPEGHA